jgi:hypothetical protein
MGLSWKRDLITRVELRRADVDMQSLEVIFLKELDASHWKGVH